MFDMVSDVLRFHDACDIPSPVVPGIPDVERVTLRIQLIEEEIEETLDAIMCQDMAGIADGIADSIYVLIGAALEYGIPIGEVWNLVQAANMRKVDPKTGKVMRRADGKILKPDGWEAPDEAIAALVVR